MKYPLTVLKVVYMLPSKCPSQHEHAPTGPEVRKKWKVDDYVCINEILDYLDDSLNDLHCDF